MLVLWHINGAFAEKMRGQKIILNFLLSGRNNSLFYESPTSTYNDIMGGGGMSYAYEYDVKYNICHLRKKSRMR
ncbi:hypothetical protein BZL68_05645 [Escherichia coli]|nr:hypothetical protein BZL68_05645 [Escherichia coli]